MRCIETLGFVLKTTGGKFQCAVCRYINNGEIRDRQQITDTQTGIETNDPLQIETKTPPDIDEQGMQMQCY